MSANLGDRGGSTLQALLPRLVAAKSGKAVVAIGSALGGAALGEAARVPRPTAAIERAGPRGPGAGCGRPRVLSDGVRINAPLCRAPSTTAANSRRDAEARSIDVGEHRVAERRGPRFLLFGRPRPRHFPAPRDPRSTVATACDATSRASRGSPLSTNIFGADVTPDSAATRVLCAIRDWRAAR